jgi:hypothetical protein
MNLLAVSQMIRRRDAPHVCEQRAHSAKLVPNEEFGSTISMLLTSTNEETHNQRYVVLDHKLFLKDVKHITFERHYLRYLHFYLLLEQLGGQACCELGLRHGLASIGRLLGDK